MSNLIKVVIFLVLCLANCFALALYLDVNFNSIFSLVAVVLTAFVAGGNMYTHERN